MSEMSKELDHEILTVAEAAKWLRLKKTKTYELVYQGVIPSFRLGRTIRIPKSGLLALVQAPIAK